MKVYKHRCTNPECNHEGDQTVAGPPYFFDNKCPMCRQLTLIEK